MKAHLKTVCPQCRRALKVDAERVGQIVRCPGCRHSFSVTSVQFPDSQAQTPSLEATETQGVIDASLESVAAAGQTSTRSDRESPETFGRFRLHELLGQGAFGLVYRAFDPLLDRFVALKRPRFAIRDADKIHRFLGEAQAAARLRHPHIVAVYESGESDGHHFIATELVEGETLAHRLERNQPERHDGVEWVRLLAEALAYAHTSGIVHRDIKPQNIMLDARGRPQILDFGLAKRLDDDTSRTVAGSIVGTPAYMSPEQARGDLAAVGPLSDQYSLGVVLYELLTGSRPFQGSGQLVVSQVVSDEPPRPRSLCPDIPKDLESICLKALEKEPAARYSTCQELAEDLGRLLRDEPVRARPLTSGQRFLRWRRRQPRLARVVLGVALLLVVAAGGGVLSVALVSHSRNELARTLANTQQQTRKASQQTERARIATEAAREKTRLADLAVEPAKAEQLKAEAAFRELQQGIANRKAAEQELQTTVAAKSGAEQSAKDSKAKTKSVEADASSIQKLANQVAKESEFQKYVEKLTEAQACLERDDVPAATRALTECPGSLRDWECQFLNAYVAAKDSTQQLWLLDSSQIARLKDSPPVAISPDGKRLAVLSGTSSMWNSSCNPEVWNIEVPGKPKPVDVVKADLPAVHYTQGTRKSFLFSRDGKWLAHQAFPITGPLMARIHISSSTNPPEKWITWRSTESESKAVQTKKTSSASKLDSVVVDALNRELFQPGEKFDSPDVLSVSPDGRLGVSILNERPIEVIHLASKRVLLSLKFARTISAKLHDSTVWDVMPVWSRDGHRLIVVRRLRNDAMLNNPRLGFGYGVLILSNE